MKIYDDGIWCYIPAGKDIWGRPVWAAYFLNEFVGYRYHRTKRDLAKIRKTYGSFGPFIGLGKWVKCLEEYVER